MIEGYVFPLSAYPGESVCFHLGDRRVQPPDAERHVCLKFTLYRRPRLIHVHDVMSDVEVLLRNDSTCLGVEYERGCNWAAAYEYCVPETLPSGLYMMKATVLDVTGAETTEETFIPFVVKGSLSNPAPMLVIIPTSTSLAYNQWPDGANTPPAELLGGRSLYTQVGASLWHRVHVERPWQFGATPNNGPGWICHWYDQFLSFLSEQGLAADFGVSHDLHADPAYLDAHRLYVSSGHDEYWSREMRDNVEAFIANGGNAAFLSGNSVWWAVRFYDGKATFPGQTGTDLDVLAEQDVLPIVSGQGRLMVCYKEKPDPIETSTSTYSADPTRATHNWHNPAPNRPGSNLNALSSRRGGNLSDGPLPEVYFTANYPAHWIYAGAPLGPSQQIGQPPQPNPCGGNVRVVGYETDALDADSPSSLVNFAFTPNLVAHGFTPLEEPGVAFGNIVLFRRNGTVFTAGSIGWINGLHPVNGVCQPAEDNTPGSPSVKAITRNVLKRLSTKSPAEVSVSNSGFERWNSAGTPASWSLDGAGIVQQRAKLPGNSQENLRRNASFAARLEATAGPARLVSSPCAVQPARWYRVTAWVKTAASPGQVGVELAGYAGGIPQSVFITTNAHSGSGMWELLSAVGSVPAGTHEARIHIGCAAGTVLEVDDVLLEDLDQLNTVSGNERLNGQHAKGVPVSNADFEGGWTSGVPAGWSGSNSGEGATWHGSRSIYLNGSQGPAHVTQVIAPIEWRSYYRIGMWAHSDQPNGAVARLYRLENGVRVALIAEATNRTATSVWTYAWNLGRVQEPCPEVFWAELELSAPTGAQSHIDNVSIDVVGTFDAQGQLS